jgi:HNH endonuclease
MESAGNGKGGGPEMATKNQRQTFRNNLVRLSPPEEVLAKFDMLCSISEGFETEDKLEDILFDACSVSNWTVPWESDAARLTIRARLIDHHHPEYKEDVGGENTPREEQSYRRGYDQGFHRAYAELSYFGQVQKLLEPIGAAIHRWRVSRFHDRDAISVGQLNEPEYPCVIRSTARRSGLPLKLRYEVLLRDGKRCVCCGASVADGAVLEVDHIIPVAGGGTNELTNLQTLCFDCNRGKADAK